MRYKWVVLCCLLAVPVMGMAADKNNRFAIKGAGIGTCNDYVQARNEKTPQYFLFGGWLDGYLTAQNEFRKDTFDVVSWENTDILAAFLAKFCEKNPKARFYQAVGAMVTAMMPRRITTSSKVVEVKYGEHRTALYEETMRRVQKQLRKLKLYKGGADGIYGAGTRGAIEAYQKKNKIRVTGIPDQITLYHLFLSPSGGKSKP